MGRKSEREGKQYNMSRDGSEQPDEQRGKEEGAWRVPGLARRPPGAEGAGTSGVSVG